MYLYGEIFGDLLSFPNILLPLLFWKYDFVYCLVDNIMLKSISISFSSIFKPISYI